MVAKEKRDKSPTSRVSTFPLDNQREEELRRTNHVEGKYWVGLGVRGEGERMRWGGWMEGRGP